MNVMDMRFIPERPWAIGGSYRKVAMTMPKIL